MNPIRYYNSVDKFDAILGALVLLGDAGIDYFDLEDDHTEDWWTLYAYLIRN